MNRLRRCPKELKGHEDLAASKTTTLATEKEAVEGPLNSLLPESDDITETTQKLKEIKP